MFVEAADEIDALRGAVRSLAGWVRELDPHPSLDPCEYLTDEAEMAAVRRAFVMAPRDNGPRGNAARTGPERQQGRLMNLDCPSCLTPIGDDPHWSAELEAWTCADCCDNCDEDGAE